MPSLAQRLIDEGIKKGIEKGIEKGLEKGIEKNRRETAINLLAKGYPIPFIKEATGLSQMEIKNLTSSPQ